MHYAYERPYRFGVRAFVNNTAGRYIYLTSSLQDAIQVAKLQLGAVAVVDRETGKRLWDRGLRFSGYHGDRLAK